MPELATEFSMGAPVALDQIERELKKLWADGEGGMTRASLVNLAVYSETAGSLPRNTQLVSQITEEHACRALVITADPNAREDHAEAWINAHCHMRGGAKQVCSEQISFRLNGTKLLPSILFSHLDSDLPLYLWWQAPLPQAIDPQLWSWVDRLIYDSHDWPDFDAQMRLVESAQAEASQRQMILCDLNWTRIFHFRLAFAQFFDHPRSHQRFEQIEQVSLVFGREYRSTGLLFLGWIAAQLGWRCVRDNGQFAFTDRRGKSVRVEVAEEGEMPLQSFVAEAGEVEFRVRRASCCDLLEVSRGRPGAEADHQLLPADNGDLAQLVSEELLRGGARLVYKRAVDTMRDLL